MCLLKVLQTLTREPLDFLAFRGLDAQFSIASVFSCKLRRTHHLPERVLSSQRRISRASQRRGRKEPEEPQRVFFHLSSGLPRHHPGALRPAPLTLLHLYGRSQCLQHSASPPSLWAPLSTTLSQPNSRRPRVQDSPISNSSTLIVSLHRAKRR